jgi:hypothetical protein
MQILQIPYRQSFLLICRYSFLFSEGYRSINSIRAVRNKHNSLATEVIVLNSLETAGGSRSELPTLVTSSTRLKSDRAESYIDFSEFWKELHSHKEASEEFKILVAE